jgi:protein involved in polysaccharide export with SLBB domain
MWPLYPRPGSTIAPTIVLLAALLATALFPMGARAQDKPNALSTYRLNSGDVISIRVFGEDDFNREKIRLTDAGTVSFPILGEIPVLGRTVGEIEHLLTDRLKGRYLVNPRVSVWIDEYRSFFVNGMVEKPGAYPFQPGLNVRKAVSIAGGFKERASVNKIFLVRDRDPAHQPAKVDLNAEIAPGDTITVEESFF